MQKERSKWVYYAIIVALAVLCYVGTATGADSLAMLVILPVGCCVIAKLSGQSTR